MLLASVPKSLLKHLQTETSIRYVKPIVIGSPSIIQHSLNLVSTKDVKPDSEKNLPKISPIQSVINATATFGTIDVLDASRLKSEDISYGKIDPQCGAAAVKSIETAAKLTLDECLMP